ncbi:hypothetical protein DAPPUDRAFT_259554 [Daphnia pulex]|uniref:Uncharacterized protein n=1 Tax=Daphnia pulex TaxID=6669 RepID=E9HHE5_DAPPU|nr:hypothetical protein DAPPUDRAFT_259554 [Daphnia pulex]|eukprot:EFX68849.1 hypothetical protein DAPPUDRAFT_259554 [Daphnia pulex]
MPLASFYHALVGSSKLGTEVIKAFIIPKIRAIGGRIELYLDGTGQANADRIAASHIKQLTICRANRLISLTITARSSGNLGRLFTAP